MEFLSNRINPTVATESKHFDQPIHNTNREYKLFSPFDSQKEIEERNFIEEIHNILPRDDDLYDIQHFVSQPTNGNGTNYGTSEEKKNNYFINGGKIHEDFSRNPFGDRMNQHDLNYKPKFLSEECSIWIMRSQNKSPPQCLACGFHSHHNTLWNNEPNPLFQNKPAIPTLFPPNSTPILPHPYQNPILQVGPTTNPVFPHEIYFPSHNSTHFGFGVANYNNYNKVMPILPSFEGFSERKRIVRNDGNSSARQYEIDLIKVQSGSEIRTTLMIKNIPNRYTCEMLLATIDENHRGTYDFIYLPIDFKNKCNVGYAFINLINPLHIIPFYKTFEGKKWGRFSSQKVASLAYARIQGKTALISHFQNSSLMNEDKLYRPVLFCTNGPNAGKQEPFPLCAKG